MSAPQPNASPPPPHDLADTADAEPAADAGNGVKDTLNAHKGKLAIGVAATLGLMVFYNWREKKLAKSDPDEYAWLQRLKAGIRAGEAQADRDQQAGRALPYRLNDKQPGEKNSAEG